MTLWEATEELYWDSKDFRADMMSWWEDQDYEPEAERASVKEEDIMEWYLDSYEYMETVQDRMESSRE